MTILTRAAEKQGEAEMAITAIEGVLCHQYILSWHLCGLHCATRSLGNNLPSKVVQIILHHRSLHDRCIMFSYHYRLAMIAQVCPELIAPESSFKLSNKPSMDRATESSFKGTLHPAN